MAQTAIRVDALDHLVLTVRDIDQTLAFYTRGLGMRAEVFSAADGTQRHALTFGAQKINLHLARREFEPKADKPVPGSADLCFLTSQPLELWQSHLDQFGIAVIDGPVPRTGATGPVLSLYVRDPDGNLIEISVPF